MIINSLNHVDFLKKMEKRQDYIQALEEERLKIQVFQRELPLCLELVTHAIETCKQQQLSGTTNECNLPGQSESSEQTSSPAPVFEEFIPLKRASSHSDDGEEESRKLKNDVTAGDKEGKNDKNSRKLDWLRSVQLWNPPDLSSNEDSPRKVEVKKNGSGGAFHPFKKEKSTGGGGSGATPPTQGPTNRSVQPASTSSTAETGGCSGGGNKKEEKEGQSQRKSRRCWSPELHKRFLQALQQLGGSHVATPKQIRELMKVDGLTNDEVKSHLQKYRLHTRRPTPSVHHTTTTTTQAPQFVVVGGIWVPPEFAAMAKTTTSDDVSGVGTSNGIYAPIATLPPPFQQAASAKKHKTSHSDNGGTENDGGAQQSHSSATSSSTHMTAVSPSC